MIVTILKIKLMRNIVASNKMKLGYNDDEIDTIFDGNPDAYWNID